MARESASDLPSIDRIPPYSEDGERGVLGSVLLDAENVMDLCVERQLLSESFYVPAHRKIFAALLEMNKEGSVIDVLTLVDRLTKQGTLESVGGITALNRLIDSTPTAAHAEFYIDIVRQKHLLRSIIECARASESRCYSAEESADQILSEVEQSFLNITERQHGEMLPWQDAVNRSMAHVEKVFQAKGAAGLGGIPTGLANLDRVMLGLRNAEMIVLAARPSMGKTSLAMTIAEHIALGHTADHKVRPIGVFSLEMSVDSLVMRMLCSHAQVSGFRLQSGYVSQQVHEQLTRAASVLSKAPIYLDDTGGLDVMELRARARRMKTKHNIELLVIDYLQLLRAREHSRQGRQIEISEVSGNLKAMAKELNVPVLVLSQLSRAPEQRGDKSGRPKLSDLRDSGAIEQDADVVCMLRRPCKYQEDPDFEDKTLAIVEIVKQRNGPTGEAHLNFEEDFTRFRDRARGVDGADGMDGFGQEADEMES